MNNAIAIASLPIPGTNFSQYVDAIFQFPELGTAEEKACARRYRKTGDRQAAWQLVTSHLRYVVYIARGYAGYGLPQEDLVQEGTIGLMEAVKRFDPEQNVPLRAYAAYSIRYHIHEFIMRNWRIVKVATTKARRKLFFKLRSTKQRLEWLTHKEAATIAEELSVPTGDVYDMEAALYLTDQPFDRSSDDEDDPPAPVTYLDDQRFNPESQVARDDWSVRARQAFRGALETLDARSKRIIEARWLGPQQTPFRELAEEFGISIERVRQIESRAIGRLQAEMSALVDEADSADDGASLVA